MKEDEFRSMASQFRIGKTSQMISEEAKPLSPEEQDPNMSSPDTQVAGIGSTFANIFKKLGSKKSSDIIGDYQANRGKPPEMSLDDAADLVDKYNYSKESGSPINEDNLGRLFNNVESSEDLDRMVDIAGTAEEKTTRQTFADIEGESNIIEDLKPIFKGTQQGLYTAKQQYGMRRLMVTLGDRSVDLANRIATGDHTPELLLQYQQSFTAFESLYKSAKGNARDTARALNQQKMLAKALNSKSVREMKAALEVFGGANLEGSAIIAAAKNLAARSEGEESVISNMAYILDKKLNLYTRGAVELWKNNILSGLGTHTTNIASVAAANMWENLIIDPTAFAIGKARQLGKVGDPENRIHASEFIYKSAGSYVGLRSSINTFLKSFASGESTFGQASKHESSGAVGEIFADLTGGSKAGEAMTTASTLSFRLLQAEDDAMRGVVFTSELYGLSAREGRLKGLTGKKLLEYVDKTINNPSDELYESAMQQAGKKTFTDGELKGAVGLIARYTRAMTGNMPALQFIIPFVNTPANLLQYGMDTSALAAISPRLWAEVKAGGAKGDLALAKITTGIGLTMSVWQLYEAGLISGGGPEDYAARQQLEKEGWKPNAIKGPSGKWYQVKRMEPFSTSMAFVANGLDKVKYAPTEEAARKHMAHVMLSLSETAFDSSWLKNFNEFVGGMSDDRKWETYQSGFIASLVPYSGALRTAEQLDEPTASRVSSDERTHRSWQDLAIDRAKSSIPGMSEDLRPARYWDGTVVKPTQGNFSFAASPIKEGIEGKGDIVNRELIRNGVSAREPSSVLRIGYTSFSLLDLSGGSDRLYDKYIVSVGKARREILDKMVGSSQYSKLSEGPNGERFAMLQRSLSLANRKGLHDFLKEDLLSELDENEEFNTIAEKMFSADPVNFIKDLIKEVSASGINVKQKFTPVREPIELPTDQTYMPRF